MLLDFPWIYSVSVSCLIERIVLKRLTVGLAFLFLRDHKYDFPKITIKLKRSISSFRTPIIIS